MQGRTGITHDEMELIRELMLAIVGRHRGEAMAGHEFLDDGHDDATLTRHLRVLLAAGYLRGRDDNRLGTAQSAHVLVTGVTGQGHRFLAFSRDPQGWEDATRIAGSRGGAIDADLLGDIATVISMQLHAVDNRPPVG